MQFMVIVVAITVACIPLQSDDKPDLKKTAETRLAAFEYPGSQREQVNNVGAIAQSILFTSDELDKVDAWYHKAFSIDQAFIGGATNIPWPSGVKATEAKGQQQWALFRDEIRPRNDGSGNKIVRQPTTRTFVVRTPEHTMVVTLNRGPGDKQTMISVVCLQEGKK